MPGEQPRPAPAQLLIVLGVPGLAARRPRGWSSPSTEDVADGLGRDRLAGAPLVALIGHAQDVLAPKPAFPAPLGGKLADLWELGQPVGILQRGFPDGAALG